MVNTLLLDEKISKSGYKQKYICEQLGITRSSFHYKRHNKRTFRKTEIHVLKDLLNISDSEIDNIFFA